MNLSLIENKLKELKNDRVYLKNGDYLHANQDEIDRLERVINDEILRQEKLSWGDGYL